MIGIFVLAPAHEFEWGLVASVNDVLVEIIGKGQEDVFMLLYSLNETPLPLVELAGIIYIP